MYEQELYAVARACHRWEHYLIHREFIIHSDHIALRQINNPFNTNRMHARWFTFLQRFIFTIQHKAGSLNKVVDVLSRHHQGLTIIQTEITDFERIKELYANDPDFMEHWKLGMAGSGNLRIKIKDGYLFFDGKLCILQTELRKKIIEEIHAGHLGCHFDRDKTIQQLEDRFFWPKLKIEAAKFVKHC